MANHDRRFSDGPQRIVAISVRLGRWDLVKRALLGGMTVQLEADAADWMVASWRNEGNDVIFRALFPRDEK